MLVELKLTSILLYRNPLNAFLIEVPNEAQVERIDIEIPNGPKLKGYIYIYILIGNQKFIKKEKTKKKSTICS